MHQNSGTMIFRMIVSVVWLSILILFVYPAQAEKARPKSDEEVQHTGDIKIKPSGRTKISISYGGLTNMLDLKKEIPGCLDLYDPANKSKIVKISATRKVIDIVSKDNYHYALLLLTANSNCNVQGMCGAAEDNTLLWIKLNKDLRLIEKKTADIEGCRTFISMSEPVDGDFSGALWRNKGKLTVKYEMESQGSHPVVYTLVYDRNAPENGFMITSAEVSK